MSPHRQDDSFEKLVEALLADEQYQGHPLREALALLWKHTREQLARLERVTHISDRYQNIAQEQARSMTERYNRQLRQIEKITRISDRYQGMLQDLNNALKEASTHDALTGLPNRRLLTECMKQEDGRGGDYALAVIDADRFKRVNDDHGHETGDRVLVALARTLKEGLREGDICGRWGGEEFLALLPGIDAAAATGVAERLLAGVRRLRVAADGVELPITVSIGLARRRDGEGYHETLLRADAALLEAKRAGRDRCYAAGAGDNG
ncbi:biofilm regulation diguanylate cyclase SiaD [Methylomagnum ishizawai]|uniref:biofilm regulation diguanylate cyclase SiaD n=1 Tax=Methylomagnum ishizawai TaxID=1760988 RepID=UPI001C32D3FF|nr:biofilm regulation diguanylate cyclase SiaD [Methylomagnum ishizawai]BBL74369.1 GGDEF domain-containing protein [Methylomagnum ishizawai]